MGNSAVHIPLETVHRPDQDVAKLIQLKLTERVFLVTNCAH